MALQSSVRSSLLAVKLGSCAKPKTCASSRHRQMLTFDEAGELRQKQAKQSLLFQVQSPKSAGPLGAVLEKYGTVSNLFHFTSEKKEFLFVEMSSRAEAEEVIRHAHHPAADTVVPVSSPLLWFRAGGRGQPAAEADAAMPPIVQEPSRSEAELARQIAERPTLDEQLVRHHELTRLTELGARLRYFTCELLERALAGLFPHARARPFGSSANGFGRYDCDVDMVLELAPARPETSERLAFQTMAAKPDGRVQTQRYLSIISDMMATLMPGCSQVRRILKARVPIVKYTQSFTGIDCDLSMQRNGLHMTELLYVWAQLDQRVAPLVRAVRHWAEKIHLTNAISGSSGAGRWISNFGITLLVIYFLQTRPVPVLPSVNELTQRARPGDSAEVDGAVYSFLRDPSLVPPSANSESLSQLLAAFFAFYGELDLDERAISVVWAGDFPRPAGGPLHVQNPLDRELNVTKNVTGEERFKMSSALHLMHGRLRTNIFRDEARQKLVSLLEKGNGTKAIVWDERLMGPFGLVAEYSFLSEQNVVKMFLLRPGRLPPSDVDNIFFLVRPEVGLMEAVAENVQREEELGGRRKEFFLCFVPSRSRACERVLEERRVLGTFSQITSLEVRLLPLDADLLSMEYPDGFKEYMLENDPSCLFEAAQALLDIQLKFGIISNICGQGTAAKKVYDYMLRLRRERTDSEFPAVCEIDTLLLIDREVDLITPVATQLTYEGLIDEIFGINNNTVKLPSEKFAKSDGGPIEIHNDKKQFLLSSAEELYADVRDKNFNAVGPALSKKAKQISVQYEERHSQSVSEMKNFVKNIMPSIKAAKDSLALHTSIAELIKERTDGEAFLDSLQVEQEMMNGIDTDRPHPHIEELIARKADLTKVLRLLCLQSACNSGLKPRVLDQYRRDLLQTYGFQHLATLDNLERAGLLRAQTRQTYGALRRALRLTVDDVNEQTPTDISYTFSGYAPLSVRLAQLLARPGWRSVSEALAQLPGDTLQQEQRAPAAARNRRDTGPLGLAADDGRLTLVFFLGGATFAEVAALRFLSSQDDAPTEYVVATTKMLNGNKLIESLSEELKTPS